LAKPILRHLAIFTMNPHELANFYRDVFDMEIIHIGHDDIDGDFAFVSDGYMNLALLPHQVNGDSSVGLHHFGFVVDDIDEIRRRIVARGVPDPQKRPSHRPYAEFRAIDTDGNPIDLSEHGYQRLDSSNDREVTVDAGSL
jgi:catechol 2,3-dioxygenase-like lactoylglutathione lyase family enzyme